MTYKCPACQTKFEFDEVKLQMCFTEGIEGKVNDIFQDSYSPICDVRLSCPGCAGVLVNNTTVGHLSDCAELCEDSIYKIKTKLTAELGKGEKDAFKCPGCGEVFELKDIIICGAVGSIFHAGMDGAIQKIHYWLRGLMLACPRCKSIFMSQSTLEVPLHVKMKKDIVESLLEKYRVD